VSDERVSRDELFELFGQVLALTVNLVDRVLRLEETSASHATEAAELAAQQAIERDQRRETDELLAERLGGKLVEVRPPSPFPMLVVDNDNPASPEGGP
jgi:hypothetical protein